MRSLAHRTFGNKMLMLAMRVLCAVSFGTVCCLICTLLFMGGWTRPGQAGRDNPTLLAQPGYPSWVGRAGSAYGLARPDLTRPAIDKFSGLGQVLVWSSLWANCGLGLTH